MRIWKQVDGWSIASLESSERIDDWSIEAKCCVMEQKAMMDVFDGRCAILEPMMRECGAWVREAKHWQHLIAIAELVETRKLSSWMSKRMTRSSTRRCGRVETSATAQRE